MSAYFQVPTRFVVVVVLYRSNIVFILGYRFSLFGSSIFFSFILLLFHKRFYVFLAIAICIYLCFSEKPYFSFVLLVSSVIRPEYQTQQTSCIKGKK